MKVLVIDPLPSLSGDMFLSAGYGLGFDILKLEKVIHKLGFADFKVKVVNKKAGHITANSLKISPQHSSYVDLKQVIKKITNLKLDKKAIDIAVNMIKNLIAVERELHKEKRSHRGEIFSLDTVIDALGTGMIITELGVEKCFYTQIYIPQGFNPDCEYPLLAPATLELLKGYQLNYTDIDQELITPTGASIINTLCTPEDRITSFHAVKISYSTGNRIFSKGANLLRLILAEGEFQENIISEEIYQLITSLDDITSEDLAYAQEKLFSSGALDVQISTYYGKKNRIGFTIVVLCRYDKIKALLSILFKHTSTSGVRCQKLQRFVLPREIKKLSSSLGKVGVKKFIIPGSEKYKFEYQDIKEIAEINNIPLFEVKNHFKNKLNT